MDKVELYIDNRENKLCKLLPFANIVTLDIGDIQFKKNEENILLIERKSTADLAASICDGRAREQKARMMNSGIPRNRILYLIEGNLNKKVDEKIGSLTINTLLGSIVNTQLRDGISIYKTSDINETAIFIEKLYTKLNSDEYDTFWKFENPSEITSAEYSAKLKKNKKANMNSEVWFISQLSLIPQITENIGAAVFKIYPSISLLIKKYEEIDEKLRPQLLEDIKYISSTNKERRIGPKNSEKIYNFMYSKI